MYHHIQGKFIEIHPTHVIIDHQGLGFYVHISLNTFSQIKELKEGMLFLHFHVKEDSQSFFGFAEKTERESFRQLIAISGIGPSTAQVVLSSLTPDQIASAVAVGDARTFQNVKGIGAKTAQRIVIELKGKIDLALETETLTGIVGSNTVREEAFTALTTLGFPRASVHKAVQKVLKEQPEVNDVEEMIKKALIHLS